MIRPGGRAISSMTKILRMNKTSSLNLKRQAILEEKLRKDSQVWKIFKQCSRIYSKTEREGRAKTKE